MKIKEEYVNGIIQITSSIEESVKRLGYVTFNKQLLKEEKANLTTKIKDLNNQKDELIKKISDEYGEGYIDPNTWEFISNTPQKDESPVQQS